MTDGVRGYSQAEKVAHAMRMSLGNPRIRVVDGGRRGYVSGPDTAQRGRYCSECLRPRGELHRKGCSRDVFMRRRRRDG